MNLRNKVYQMFMISPQSTDMKNEVNLKIALNNGLGGVIFFTKNILLVYFCHICYSLKKKTVRRKPPCATG